MIGEVCIRLITKIAFLKTLKAENLIGYRLILNNLSPHWINSIMPYDMTPVWKRDGMDASGVNYFTVGAIKNGMSERFNPNSPYYQSWFGGYIVKFVNPKKWTLHDHYELAVSDQKNWLRKFGNTNPYLEIDSDRTKELGSLSISGYEGKLYEGGIWSDTDVGERNKTIPFFSKRWEEPSLLNSYQNIYLYGYIAIIEITPNVKAVLYANGAKYKDTKGKNHDTFLEIKSEIKQLMQSVSMKKL